jgi:RNA polymerase sigma-70 factor, ECF subfamily
MEDLPIRMSAAEEQAYQEFSDNFGPRLRAFFISKGLRSSDAEDLAVSSVSDIAMRVEKYQSREDGGFEAWVFTVANNLLVDWWRGHPETESLPDNLEAADSLAEEVVPNKAIVLAVRHGMEQLSETDQQIIRLRYLDRQDSFAEIGKLLGIEPGTARVRLHRALEHLEAVLKEDTRITNFLTARGVLIKI